MDESLREQDAALRRSRDLLPFDPKAFVGFFSSSETRGSTRRNASKFGVPVKAACIGVAAASYVLIGGRPRMSSIVRRTLAVE